MLLSRVGVAEGRLAGEGPDGGGWRVHGRCSAQYQAAERAKNAGARAGYIYLQTMLVGEDPAQLDRADLAVAAQLLIMGPGARNRR